MKAQLFGGSHDGHLIEVNVIEAAGDSLVLEGCTYQYVGTMDGTRRYRARTIDEVYGPPKKGTHQSDLPAECPCFLIDVGEGVLGSTYGAHVQEADSAERWSQS